ncbi:MAG: S24/S26 family peptidase [Ruminococcus sp.]|nr:S24/S26 family peptidase [Ruminococcus sp.]
MITTNLAELERSGFILTTIKGTSMRPLLQSYTSQVMIEKPSESPKPGDVVLYTRVDGALVLHRIISFDGDVALIRGDNTYFLERVPISDIKGVAKSFWRGNSESSREISVDSRPYKLYVRLWNLIYPLRKLLFGIKSKLRRKRHS